MPYNFFLCHFCSGKVSWQVCPRLILGLVVYLWVRMEAYPSGALKYLPGSLALPNLQWRRKLLRWSPAWTCWPFADAGSPVPPSTTGSFRRPENRRSMAIVSVIKLIVIMPSVIIQGLNIQSVTNVNVVVLSVVAPFKRSSKWMAWMEWIEWIERRKWIKRINYRAFSCIFSKTLKG